MQTVVNNLAWPVAVIILAVIGAVTYLGSQHILAASDITTIVVLILGGVGITATAHTTATAITNAVNTPAPGQPNPPLV